MFRVKEDNRLPSPQKEQVEKLEKFYRIAFPKEFKVFINEYNGAIPLNNTFEINGNEYVVERFLCIIGNLKNEYEEGWADIGVVISQIFDRLADDPNKLGMSIIPIAALFAGDYVCLDYRNNEVEPEVCIWYHEESAPFQPVTKKIANSFDEFLDILK